MIGSNTMQSTRVTTKGIASSRMATIAVTMTLLLLAGNASAGSFTFSGTLKGSRTYAVKEFGAYGGDVVDYEVEGQGSGSNTLTFKLQQKRTGIGWVSLAKNKLHMPRDSASGSATVRDSGYQRLRIKVSRKLGTKKIKVSGRISW